MDKTEDVRVPENHGLVPDLHAADWAGEGSAHLVDELTASEEGAVVALPVQREARGPELLVQSVPSDGVPPPPVLTLVRVSSSIVNIIIIIVIVIIIVILILILILIIFIIIIILTIVNTIILLISINIIIMSMN